MIEVAVSIFVGFIVGTLFGLTLGLYADRIGTPRRAAGFLSTTCARCGHDARHHGSPFSRRGSCWACPGKRRCSGYVESEADRIEADVSATREQIEGGIRRRRRFSP